MYINLDLHEVMETKALSKFSQPPYECPCVHWPEMCQHNVEQDCHEPVSDLQCVKVQMVGAKFETDQLGLLTWEQAEFNLIN